MLIKFIFLGVFLGGAGAWFMSRFATSLGTVDIPEDRSSHIRPTPTGGGVGLLVAFLSVSVIFSSGLLSLWLPATLLALVSLFDDRLNLKPGIRLLFQFGAAASVVLSGVFSDVSVYSLLLVPFWLAFIVGTANFYNFMDGINGIAGITGSVGFALVAAYCWMANTGSTLLLLSLALSAACLGFLPFNVPKARVFMGDVGSVLLGFVFAGMTFILSMDFAGFLCFLAFMMPFYADALITLYGRWRDGEKLTQAHRCHLYQLLANELSYPHWLVSLGYGFVQLVTGATMLWAWITGLWLQLFLGVLYFGLFFFFAGWVRKKSNSQVKKNISFNP